MRPPLTARTMLTAWVFDSSGVLLAVVLTCLYAVCLVRARRRGARVPWLRTAAFAIVGVGSLVYATCGALAAYRSSLFWVAASQAAVLSAVTPLGLALGSPITVAEKALGDRGARRLHHALTGPVARALMFPLMSSLLAVGSLIAIFFTGYFASSVSSVLVRDVLYVQLLGTGLLVVLPLLGEDMLPSWCTHPVRAIIAFVDGLLDAIPGILVMTAPGLLAQGVAGVTGRTWGPAPAWDQKLGGGAMLAIAEVGGLPLLAAVFVSWVRADDADAVRADALLDARAADSVEPGRDRPWWETDPRFAEDCWAQRCRQDQRPQRARGSSHTAVWDGPVGRHRHPTGAKARMGVQLQATRIGSELRIRQIVRLYAGLYSVTMSADEIADNLESIGLAAEADKPFKQLSGGQQQRLALFMAVIHEPVLLLLDEPTAGLDPQLRRQLWGRIEGIRQGGRSIFLTTHSMQEAQAGCDRVAIIDHGKLLTTETPLNLIAKHKDDLRVGQVGHEDVTRRRRLHRWRFDLHRRPVHHDRAPGRLDHGLCTHRRSRPGKGVFQRLRVTPAPTWTIMTSRLAVQVVANLIIAVVVLVIGSAIHHLSLDVGQYALVQR